MLNPLPIDSSILSEILSSHFKINKVSLDFLPIGENSWLYIVSQEDTKLYVLKIQTKVDSAIEYAQGLLSSQSPTWFPAYKKTVAGKLSVKEGDYYYSVQEYIVSDSLRHAESDVDEEYLLKLGKILKELHSIPISSEAKLNLITDSYSSIFIEPATKALDKFASWNSKSPGVEITQEFIAKLKPQIDLIFNNERTLGVELSSRDLNRVLTHGDVHFANIIETTNNDLYLIDWDWVRLSLPSHDFMYFSDVQLGILSRSYGSDILANKVEIQYYRNHLMLRALWFWLNRAMAGEYENIEPTLQVFREIFGGSSRYLRAIQ